MAESEKRLQFLQSLMESKGVRNVATPKRVS